MRMTRARIHLSNLYKNVRAIREHIGDSPEICVCVKANGYGHGAVQVAKTAVAAGATRLGVATCDEAVELRENRISTPILLLGLPAPEEVETLVRNGISCVATDIELIDMFAARASALGEVARLHVKIDTGMGRIGCRATEAVQTVRRVYESGAAVLEGVCTHFPVADMDPGFTRDQISRFDRAIAEIKEAGMDPGIVHAANSPGIVDYPEAWYDMVRPGILTYGYYSSPRSNRPVHVEPVMELVSAIVFIKRVPANTGISYGLTYKTDRETTIATVGAGYGDGYSRLLSNRAEVSIGGKRYGVAGNICMDQFMVDIGNNREIQRYDEVMLFGGDPDAPDAEELAGIIGTIPYEVICAVSKRVPRDYIRPETHTRSEL